MIRILKNIIFYPLVVQACIPVVEPPTSPNSSLPPSTATTNEQESNTTTVSEIATNECVTVELNPGRPCVFPFTYQYKEHYECLPFKEKYWCALTDIYDKDEWGYCDQSLCPPTAGKATEQPGENSTVNTLPEWEAGETQVEMMNNEQSYTCRINFQLALGTGVQFKDATGICSGSSSTSTDEMIAKLGLHQFAFETKEGIKLECEVGVAMIDPSTLSEEVLSSTLSCEPVDADCVTMDGPSYPANCIFPFTYQGRRFQACTDKPGSSKLWCPTKLSDNQEADEENWGYCSTKCGYCAGSPINERGPGQKCGYDCLLNPSKNMVGYEKAPLLKPKIDIEEPKQNNYIKETSGQHQLHIGPQLATISCPGTRFHHRNLKGQTSVKVKCGPKQYRFTVSTTNGIHLGEDFKNDQFGCDPCPAYMSYVKGLLDLKKVNTVGLFYNIGSILECQELCSERVSCNTFEYSEHGGKCNLVEDIIKANPHSKLVKGVTICSRQNNVGDFCPLRKAERGWPSCHPGYCPADWECKKLNDCLWEKKRSKIENRYSSGDNSKQYWKNLLTVASGHKCYSTNAAIYDGVCCPTHKENSCVYSKMSDSLQIYKEDLLDLQCGFKLDARSGRKIPGFCNDNYICDYSPTNCVDNNYCKAYEKSWCSLDTNKCEPCRESSLDCAHMLRNKHCFKGHKLTLCRECSRDTDCGQNRFCVRGNCGNLKIKCKGFIYKAAYSQNQAAPELEVIHNGQKAHLHLNNNMELVTANYPWSDQNGNTVTLNTDGKARWQPIVAACQDAVTESQTKGLTSKTWTWDRNKNSFFNGDSDLDAVFNKIFPNPYNPNNPNAWNNNVG